MLLDNPRHLAAFRRRLMAWYAKNARELPWRETADGAADPYRVWVSEIMLQQTTTQTVCGYFERFVQKFPTVTDLAAAELDEVNRLWEGLGYYRRCSQMHRAAQEIVERFDGVFPDNSAEIRSLPGIGRYTAGAILSIAFDQREPILEANTVRLHARLTGLRTDPTQTAANETLWDFARKILPIQQAGPFNQALMDLGSIVCTYASPNCENCPVMPFCEAFRQNLQAVIPFQKAKEAKIDRNEMALLVRCGKKILVMRYPPQGTHKTVRWAGLWDFPRCETRATMPEQLAMDDKIAATLGKMTGRKLSVGPLMTTLKHSVTKYRITLHFCKGTDSGKAASSESYAESYETRWVTPEELQRLPLHSTARKLAKWALTNDSLPKDF